MSDLNATCYQQQLSQYLISCLFFFYLRSESSASMAIPMLGHIPGMISNSLDDEDDDYDS